MSRRGRPRIDTDDPKRARELELNRRRVAKCQARKAAEESAARDIADALEDALVRHKLVTSESDLDDRVKVEDLAVAVLRRMYKGLHG